MDILKISESVADALAAKKPVVALESTIIAHGMPYPRNVETALRVEQTVRNAGATPATCAVINGQLRAGLSVQELEWLGQEGVKVAKCSRRDLAFLCSRGLSGATTVAATMIIAHRAGIRVFATGGIGGVHRGAANTMDISADLQELARTPVAVVSAGAKSILDIGLTLEYLETFGVPVVGYGTGDFPAFYSSKSGYSVDFRIDTPEEMAHFLHLHHEVLGMQSGVLVANPVPEAFSMPYDTMERAIAAALAEADELNIRGKALTPFLLGKIEEITEGRSLETNIELVCHNAALAAMLG